jgi:hypothetical protein
MEAPGMEEDGVPRGRDVSGRDSAVYKASPGGKKKIVGFISSGLE